MTGRRQSEGPAARTTPAKLYKSWHLTHHQHDFQPEEFIPVLFLQRLSHSAIKQAESKLNDCDTSGVTLPPLPVQLFPWFRDEPLSANGVCAFLKSVHDHIDYFSTEVAILVETEDDDCIVVVSIGQDDEQQPLDVPIVTGVRVKLDAARPLATQVFSTGTFEGLLEDYELLNLAKDYPPKHNLPESKQPVFEGDLKFSSPDQLTIISLVHLGDKLETWKNKFADSNVNITIVDNNANPPSRAELYQMFEALEKMNTADDRIGYIFFIDNILNDQIIAVSRTGVWANDTGASSISILPVNDLVKIWKAAVAGTDDRRAGSGRVVENDVQQECGDIMRRERIYNPGIFEEENEAAPTVWFLQAFSHEEGLQIRNMLANPADGADEMGAEYAFMGHHADSIEELLEVFQRGDVFSPSYDPLATMRFREYPRHFFAVDRRIFTEGKIILGSSLDFYHPTTQLGWHVGTMPVGEAMMGYINLDIANVGPEELADDAEKVWLSDLKEYSKEYDPDTM